MSVFVCFRQTDGVLQERFVWQHPESVCHHSSTLVISPVDHMEELWTWRWACESHFSIILLCKLYYPIKINTSRYNEIINDHPVNRLTHVVCLSVWSWCPSCQCERYVSAEELCNMSCLSRLPQLFAQFSPDGHLLLNLKERENMIWSKVWDRWQGHWQTDDWLCHTRLRIYLLLANQFHKISV